MEMIFTYEQLEAIIEKTMQNCLKKVNDDDTVADYMQKSFNNGVRMMQKEMIIQLLLKEVKA